jgi:hypothetical protein
MRLAQIATALSTGGVRDPALRLLLNHGKKLAGVAMGSGRWVLVPAILLIVTSRALSQSSPEPAAILETAHSIVVPISPRGRVDSARKGAQSRLILKIVGYTPPADGAVQLGVTISCRGAEHELGRVAVFPNRPFTVLDTGRVQMFGLPLPVEPSCLELKVANVNLTPTVGTGIGARVVIDSISVE